MSSENRTARGEINRLNKAIAAEEQTINAIFQRMGQTYFAAHRKDPEENQKANVQGILDAMERARRCKEQINVLRGVAICPSCRAEVSSSAAFCSHCGTRMPGQVTPAVPTGGKRCPNCGSQCAPGTRFCKHCGTRLENAFTAPTPVPAPVSVPMPTPEPAPIPEPMPIPEPAPMPEPAPIPEPVPTPEPAPIPEPAPMSEPMPIPEPVPTPEPAPIPESMPMPDPAELPEQPPEAPVPAAPVAPAKRRCPHCGTELEDEYRFCLECGARVE